MTLTGKELVKLAQKNGWKIDRIESSHHILIKGNQTVSIPVHSGKGIPTGLLKQAHETDGAQMSPVCIPRK